LDTVSATFREGIQQLSLVLSEDQLEQLVRYQHELLDWNTRINLTAITEPEEVFIKHFLDSLSLLSVYDTPETAVLDIGSGAGFPGLVLQIARPQWRVTLLEATGKKIKFLQHMIDVLHLPYAEAISGRAEEIAHNPSYRGKFDLVTARAVSALPILLEYAAPYARIGGMLVLPKKGELTEELSQGKRAATQVGALFVADVPVTLPGLTDGRRLLVWKQSKPCPPQFPRHSSIIMKKPLGRSGEAARLPGTMPPRHRRG
jgi:16S rRNA (guanine527-N7)-methyltransferase